MKIIKLFLFFNICLVAVSDLRSAEYRYTIDTSATQSDNIARTTNGGSGSSINTGLSFLVRSTTNSDWNVDLSGNFSYQTFSDNSIQDQEFKQFLGRLIYRPRASNFDLQILESISQEPQNRFSTDSVNNLRDTRTFSAIPNYFFRMTSVDRLNFGYVYVDTNNGGIESDTGRVDGSRLTKEFNLSYERQLNSSQQFFIGGTTLKTDFDASLVSGAVDFDQDDLFVRWVVSGRATQIQLEYGLSKIDDQLGNNIDTNLLNFSVRRQINRIHALVFDFEKGFDSEIDQNFATNITNINGQTSNFITAQKVQNFNLIYSIENEDGLNLNLRLFKSKVSAAANNNDENREGVQINVIYPISAVFGDNSRAEIGLNFLKTNNRFDTTLSVVTENDISRTELSYTQFFTSEVSIFMDLVRRNTSGDSFGSFGADSNSITIGFRYAPSGRF